MTDVQQSYLVSGVRYPTGYPVIFLYLSFTEKTLPGVRCESCSPAPRETAPVDPVQRIRGVFNFALRKSRHLQILQTKRLSGVLNFALRKNRHLQVLQTKRLSGVWNFALRKSRHLQILQTKRLSVVWNFALRKSRNLQILQTKRIRGVFKLVCSIEQSTYLNCTDKICNLLSTTSIGV